MPRLRRDHYWQGRQEILLRYVPQQLQQPAEQRGYQLCAQRERHFAQKPKDIGGTAASR